VKAKPDPLILAQCQKVRHIFRSSLAFGAIATAVPRFSQQLRNGRIDNETCDKTPQ